MSGQVWSIDAPTSIEQGVMDWINQQHARLATMHQQYAAGQVTADAMIRAQQAYGAVLRAVQTNDLAAAQNLINTQDTANPGKPQAATPVPKPSPQGAPLAQGGTVGGTAGTVGGPTTGPSTSPGDAPTPQATRPGDAPAAPAVPPSSITSLDDTGDSRRTRPMNSTEQMEKQGLLARVAARTAQLRKNGGAMPPAGGPAVAPPVAMPPPSTKPADTGTKPPNESTTPVAPPAAKPAAARSSGAELAESLRPDAATLSKPPAAQQKAMNEQYMKARTG